MKKEINQPNAKQQPNIVFVGKEKKRDFKTGKQILEPMPEAPKKLEFGSGKVLLPDTKEQKKGFYHEKAALITNTFPQLYKTFKPKGE